MYSKFFLSTFLKICNIGNQKIMIFDSISLKKHLLVCLLIFGFSIGIKAQFRTGNYWKKTRNELVFGIGPSNFLGELGGKDAIGKDISPRDLEISETKFVINAGWRYYIQRTMAIRTTLYYGMVSGNDKDTKEPFRQGRNLSFKSPIYEFSSIFEYYVLEAKQGRMYKVRGTKTNASFIVGVCPFLGIGAFYFNPKAQYKGKWVALQPLGTEGQGLRVGTKLYPRYSYCIPMGITIRYPLNQSTALELELGFRKTFTDYIDDVSTSYYDNDSLRAARGDAAADLADRSLVDSPAGSASGDQRGDFTERDSYMFGVVTFNYKISKKRGFRRIKSRRSLPSF